MYRIIISSVITLLSSAFLFAQNFSGIYTAYNPSNGIKIVLSLNQNSNDIVSGDLTLNDNDTYKIEGTVEENYGETDLVGSIRKGNEVSFFEAYLEEDQLIFVWLPVNAQNQPDYNSAIEVVLNKEKSMSNNYKKDKRDMPENSHNNQKNNNYQRDPSLVGSWRYSESYTSGDFSMVTEKYMEVRPDGSYSYGNGQVVGGGNSGSFDSGRGGDVISGNWRTENGIIYIDEGGYGNWVPYSGYYIEGNSLMLKFNNGSNQLWERY